MERIAPRSSTVASFLLGVLVSLAAAQDGFLVKNFAFTGDAESVYALPPSVVRDREALLAFKELIRAEVTGTEAEKDAALPPRIRETWKAGSNPCLPLWAYITCSNGRVTTLQLSNLQIKSKFPEVLAALTELEGLHLDGNQLYLDGSDKLPDSWGSTNTFNNLKYLNLADNNLVSTLPATWGAKGVLPRLTFLDMSYNLLHGPLPQSWAARNTFRSLTTLDLHGNMLGQTAGGGTIGNALNGWAQATTGTFNALVHMDLSDNGFSGQIPPNWGSFGNFANLKVLDISYNDFTGTLEGSWVSQGAWPRLEYLLLQGNRVQNAAEADLSAWTAVATGFPSLKGIVIFPGNTNICGSPLDGGSMVAYQITDAFFERYNGKSVACPTAPSPPPPPPSP